MASGLLNLYRTQIAEAAGFSVLVSLLSFLVMGTEKLTYVGHQLKVF